ncbi:MAG: UDP-2,3-diacylglucosamine diphosphatase [Bacteroidales bacterium]|nr:UDP-2,3-diacylglucosamine diphosphatase [Bacteroidales bacterium]
MLTKKRTYFISDVHLGLPNRTKSIERERRLVQWLDEIKEHTEALYLLGDIFDFWYEYKHVVPKGFVRLLGKLGELSDAGIPIYFFTGNHDIWAFDYFEKELGISIIRKPITKVIHDKVFHLGHGDGLGPADKGFKALKWLFTNKLAQLLFSRVHPNFALWLGNTWSRKKRYSESPDKIKYLGVDKEWLILYAKSVLERESIDYFIFGHRHLALHLKIEQAEFVNLGDWIHNFTFAYFDGNEMVLQRTNGEIIPLSVPS